MKELDIIYEDDCIILCHKPAGVAVQTKRLGQQDMESLLKNYRAKKSEPPYISIVHRLDQPVEGIMVFAKNQKAAAGLSKQIQQHMIGKHYYAVSEHRPAEPQGVLEDYLLTDKKTNFTQVVEMPDSTSRKGLLPNNAKQARLEYKVVEVKGNKTLFDIKLHTGRQHQIRVQMAHMGCPLIGDSKYGGGQNTHGLALCSYRLELNHPVSGRTMEFSIAPKGKVFVTFHTHTTHYAARCGENA